jgi:elongator complex protein 5
VVIFDSLTALASNNAIDLSSFLYSIISPSISIFAVYHADVPLLIANANSYSPSPLTLLKYLSTTILTLHSLSHILAEKSAKQRSQEPPTFGLAEEVEGIVIGNGANDPRGTVIEMEYRRRSGRTVHEWYFLPRTTSKTRGAAGTSGKTNVMLLDDDPLCQGPIVGPVEREGEDEGATASTFSLALTEKQRKDREGVVLPYFDAQREGGIGQGGKILYEMGAEDDFDDEEDEI